MVKGVLFLKIIPHMLPILFGCVNVAKPWLISINISKGKANKSSQYNLASNFHPLWVGWGNVYTITLFARKSYQGI